MTEAGLNTSAVTRTLSVMFIDMVGSTAMLDDIGEAAFASVRQRYTEVVRRTMNNRSGREVKSTGDGSLAVFDSATQALAAAADIQQAMAVARAAGERQPLLKIGLALGDCRIEDDDVFGVPVVIAARLCDRAEVDSVLATDLITIIAGPGTDVEFGERFELTLKGLAQPVAVRTVEWRTAAGSGLPLPAHMSFDHVFPFFGRDEPMASIDAQYQRGLAGELTATALVGEPGVGKTRIVSAIAERLHAGGAIVLFGRCDEHQSTALQPVSEWLDFVIDNSSPTELVHQLGPTAHHLSRLAPHLAQRLPQVAAVQESSSDGDRYQLYRAVAQWLTAMSADRPVLAVIDDVQWATASTVELLQSLVSTPSLGRITLLFTMRDTEAAPNGAVADLFTQLHRTSRFVELPIAGFGANEVEAMIATAAGRPLHEAERAAAHTIAGATGGNALFVTELVRHLTDTDAIATVGAHLELVVDVSELSIPSSIKAMVDQRLRRLGPEAVQIFEAAAVVGARFEPSLIASMVEADDDRVDDLLGRGLDARLVVERRTPRPHMEFSHAIVRHTIYESINGRRRVQLHRAAMHALEAGLNNRIDDRVLAIAHHANMCIGRDIDDTIATSTRAARYADSRLDFSTATHWYSTALQLAESSAQPPEMLLALLIGLGNAHKRSGRAGFRQPLLRAAALAKEVGDLEARREALLATHRGVYAQAGLVDELLVEALEDMLRDTPPGDTATRALITAQLASELTWAADLDRKLAIAHEAEKLARDIDDDRVLARVLQCLFDVQEIVEPGTQLMDRSRELFELGRQLNDDYFCFFGALNLATSSIIAGCLDVAGEAVATAYEFQAKLGEPILETHLNPRPASLLIATGNFAEGLAVAERGYQMRLDTKQPEALMVYAAQQFEWLRHLGKLGDVEPLIEATVAEEGSLKVYAAALALIYASSDRRDQAAELWQNLAHGDVRTFLEGTQSVLISLSLASELAFLLGDRHSAEQLLPLVDDRKVDFAVAGPANRGPLTIALAMVHATLGHHDEACELFASSITTCERVGMLPEAVHVRLHFANYLIGHGEAAQAHQLATEAHEIAVRLDMTGPIEAAAQIIDATS